MFVLKALKEKITRTEGILLQAKTGIHIVQFSDSVGNLNSKTYGDFMLKFNNVKTSWGK